MIGRTNADGGGADLTGANATPNKVLNTYKFFAEGSDEIQTGTMPNYGGQSVAHNPTSNYVTDIVTGQWVNTTGSGSAVKFKLNFSGYVDQNTIVSQAVYGLHPSIIKAGELIGGNGSTGNGVARGTYTSDATATAGYIYTGKTAYVNGAKITGTMTVSSVVSFSVATYSKTQFTATWKNPAKGPYSGVIIRGKIGGYPTSVSDGTIGYQGVGSNSALNGSSSVTISGATAGTTYYFRCWMYCTCSAGNMYSGYLQTTAATANSGSKTFTSSGTFTVPTGIRSVDVFLVGGGGAGSWGNYGRGGGAGYTKTVTGISVTPGQNITVTVGAGGGHVWPNAKPGGASSFGSYSVSGGQQGGAATGSVTSSNWKLGGNGGSGGGFSSGGSRGGSNGSNGLGVTVSGCGIGQGTTTRAWGNSSGTLYAGGGGSGGYWNNTGGDGGGGNGAITDAENYSPARVIHATAGKPNTGGGGGGASRDYDYDGNQYDASPAGGGSGIVIVRW